MKRLFQLGLVIGLAGTLAAAWFLPWVEYTRYRSEARVVANTGRLEQFVVRLPSDRIGDPIRSASGTEAATIEHFRLRDTAGNVIGLAARHRVSREGNDEISWFLAVPSRGTITLTTPQPVASNTVEAALAARDTVPGGLLEPQLSFDAPYSATSVATTGEFTEIDFELLESWQVTGVLESGQIRGTLMLNTVGRQSS